MGPTTDSPSPHDEPADESSSTPNEVEMDADDDVTGFVFQNPLGLGAGAITPTVGMSEQPRLTVRFSPEYTRNRKGSGKLKN